MNLRPPRSHSTAPREGALDYEIAREQAAALGRLGRALKRALAALAEFERTQRERAEDLPAARTPPASAVRARLVQDASYALWCFIIQREACGLRDPRPVLREYRVPADVHNRMGVFGTEIPQS